MRNDRPREERQILEKHKKRDRDRKNKICRDKAERRETEKRDRGREGKEKKWAKTVREYFRLEFKESE